jgi:DNA repair exonuclease SbcCD nuclease subunit
VKIVVRGDVHLGLVSDGLSRLEEQRRVLKHTVEVVGDLKPDLFVDLGDLFDSPKPAPDAVAAAVRYFGELARLPTDCHLLAGNHDKPTRGSVNSLLPFVELGEILEGSPTIHLEPGYHPTDRALLLFLPFVTDAEARAAGGEEFPTAQHWIDRWGDYVLLQTGEMPIVVFSHLEVPGARYADDDRTQRDVGTKIPDSLLESERVLRVYAGHVHRYQELERVTVVGSALHVDFGEATDRKGMIVVEV